MPEDKPQFAIDAKLNSQGLSEILLSELKRKEMREQKMKESNAYIFAIVARLYEKMSDEGIPKVSIADELTGESIEFKPDIEHEFSLDKDVTKTDKFDEYPGFFKFLRDNGHADVIKTKESVHHATRKKVLEEIIKKVKLPTFIKERFEPTVKWNKSAVERIVEKAMAHNSGGSK